MLRAHDTVLILEDRSISMIYFQQSSHWFQFNGSKCLSDITYLTRCVHDLRDIVLSLISDRPTIRTLDCRIVTLCKLLLDILYRQRTFTCKKKVACQLCQQVFFKGFWRSGDKCATRWTRISVSLPTDRLPTTAIFLCLGILSKACYPVFLYSKIVRWELRLDPIESSCQERTRRRCWS